MGLDTYANLKTALANHSHRADLTAYMGDFITLAEQDIWHDLRVKEMAARATVSTSSGTRYENTPTGLLSVRRIYLNTSPIQHMQYQSPEQITSVYQNSAGKPKYYSIIGGEFEFERVPDATYDLYVVYYKKLTALSDSNTSNAILTNYPAIYFYGAMVHLSLHIQDDNGAAKYKAAFDAYISNANSQTKDIELGNGLMVRAA